MAVRSPRSLRTALRCSFAALVLATLVVLAGPAARSSAHAELISSNPASGATLAAVPGAATLTFTDEINPTFVRAAVSTPAATAPVTVQATTQGATVSVPVADAGPGAYRVVYRVVSADGHPVSGEVRFTVSGTPTAVATATSGAAAAEVAATPTAGPSATAATPAGDPSATAATAATPATPETAAPAGSAPSSGNGSGWLVGALAVAGVAGAGAVVAAVRGRRA